MRLLPEWRKAATSVGQSVGFGTVDCTVHGNLCSQVGGDGQGFLFSGTCTSVNVMVCGSTLQEYYRHCYCRFSKSVVLIIDSSSSHPINNCQFQLSAILCDSSFT